MLGVAVFEYLSPMLPIDVRLTLPTLGTLAVEVWEKTGGETGLTIEAVTVQECCGPCEVGR